MIRRFSTQPLIVIQVVIVITLTPVRKRRRGVGSADPLTHSFPEAPV